MTDTAPTPAAPTNRLGSAHSPYLQQHARNPVDWYPWGEEALERARREDRPLLVSIGYSTCHWCHVMARESFQDPETAALMNERFVNVKVDREQRPDLDRIYQRAHQLLTGRPGGWPLTLFLAPDQTPYFAGTYFPPEPHHGLPGFRELLKAADEFYHRQRDRVEEQNAQVRDALARTEELGTPTDALDAAPLAEAVRQAQAQYDRDHGGFGGAPKFPQPTLVGLLLHLGKARDDGTAREMALDSLRRMAASGLYDHLGGGFFRYCVDAEWSVPHFEKMLYDNALLLPLYADAWRQTGEPGFRRVVEETAAWVVREMEAPDGGYYAALDAESGGEEGAFYRWTKEEAQGLLDEDEYRVAARSYGLADPPNFEDHWHLRRVRELAEVAGPCRMDEGTAASRLESARRKLFEARKGRTRPGRDHKVLTAWNALMFKAMARAGRTLGRVDLVASAERALAAIRERAFADGRLLADPDEGLPAYLDDHAFLLDAVLELLQARWRDADLALARTLADTLLARFADADNGGFFFTADDHEALLQRTRPAADDSLPAGNAVAARALARLGHVVGEPLYLEAAEGTVRGVWGLLQEYPHACAALTTALEELLAPPAVVVLRGDPETAAAWRDRLDREADPRRLLFTIPAGAEGPPGGAAPASGVSAQVCAGHRCLGPAEDEATLAGLLDAVANDAA